MRIVLSLVLCLCMVGVAQARPRRTYTTSSSPSYSSAPVSSYTSGHGGSGHGGSDQERCQAEADYMAANNITGHVWSCIGSFEGVGYGSSPNCNTCTPSGRMSLTGDASAQGRNGMWYRVRSWR
jgi:hypothetical protein